MSLQENDADTVTALLSEAFVTVASSEVDSASTTTVLSAQQLIARENATLFALFTICRSDDPCSVAFSLTISNSQEDAAASANRLTRVAVAASEADAFIKFKSQLVLAMARPDSSFSSTRFGAQMRLDSFDPDQADVWLRLMRTVRICPEGMVWRRTQGCVCPDQQSCLTSETAGSSNDLQSIRFAMLTLIGVMVIGFLINYLSLQRLAKSLMGDKLRRPVATSVASFEPFDANQHHLVVDAVRDQFA